MACDKRAPWLESVNRKMGEQFSFPYLTSRKTTHCAYVRIKCWRERWNQRQRQ